MNNILWVASYPKSGNTWLRAFLSNYIANMETPVSLSDLNKFCEGDMASRPYETLIGAEAATAPFEEIYSLREKAHQLISKSHAGQMILVKTHVTLGQVSGMLTITPSVTWGAVYVVRNPLDVVVSYASHYGISVDQAIASSLRTDHAILRKPGLIDQIVGNWSQHVTGWTQTAGLKRLVLRYEDMLRDPESAFKSLVTFGALPYNRKRLKRAIRFSSFKTLRQQESNIGFVEASSHGQKFFRSGTVGDWRHALTEENIAQICEGHRDVMQMFGYVDSDGQPRVRPGPMKVAKEPVL